jgi:hypothetical protein
MHKNARLTPLGRERISTRRASRVAPYRATYFEDEPVGASGPACCSGGLDQALTECVGVVLSSKPILQNAVRDRI